MGRIQVGGEESAEAADLCQGSLGSLRSGGFGRKSGGIRWCRCSGAMGRTSGKQHHPLPQPPV